LATWHHLHGTVEAWAQRSPGNLAVVDGPRSLSYRELDGRANQVAHLLIGLGVQRGDRVGIYLEKSLESLVAVYGVLKAGAAYVPLDPRAPAARLAFITADCGIRILLTSGEKAPSWPKLVDAGSPVETFVVLDDRLESSVRTVGPDEVDRCPDSSPGVPVIDLDLAYILYTSGSTGTPKGVKLTHLNALTFVEWAVKELRVAPDDRVSSHAPLHFDLSVFDIFAAHLAGACVVLVPSKASTFPIEVSRFIRSNDITVWYSVPSILSLMVERGGLVPGDFPSLRTILFAGEVFPTKYLRRLMELVPHARFVNLYGPTETNVCTWYEVVTAPEHDDPVPIGRAIDDVEVFAVTTDGRKACPQEIGELHVRGSTVMSGYWGDPERTARTLGAHPFGAELADRCYQTGDLVRQNDDGDFEFVGRRDAQIKSRGYRIELGEIESALNAHPDVLECAAVAVPDDLVTNRIIAFVAVRSDVDGTALARFCAQRIPGYMIPERFELSDSLPKTSTGKTDRQALQASRDLSAP
jgi:amino acid adenylation domain-containing protein